MRIASLAVLALSNAIFESSFIDNKAQFFSFCLYSGYVHGFAIILALQVDSVIPTPYSFITP
jgi:hypothetical protein